MNSFRIFLLRLLLSWWLIAALFISIPMIWLLTGNGTWESYKGICSDLWHGID